MARITSICFYLSLLLVMMGLANSAHAYRIVVSEQEFMAASDRCKEALVRKLRPGRFKNNYLHSSSRARNKEESRQTWKVGGWHYCGGVVKLSRAKLANNPEERLQILNSAIADINYSFLQIDPRDPWAIEMATALAEAYMELGKWQISFKILDEILTIHPQSPRALTMYGLVHYRRGNYESALEYFGKSNEESPTPSAQTTYFMGLAALKKGDLQQAQTYADEAEKLGYPLTGLKRLLSQANHKPN